MDFARQQRDPKRHVIGFTFVVLLHAVVIYGLMTGLARKAVEVIKKPVTATIVEEIKKPPPPPPPPPPKKIVEPPKPKAPVQPYIPPPDIPVPPPPVEAPTITAPPTPTPPPPEPYVIQPPAPPPVVIAPPAPPPPPKPAVRKDIQKVKVSGENPEYPGAAIRAGISKGYVLARVNVDEDGNVTNVTIVKAEPPRFFAPVVIDALKTWKLQADGTKYVAEVEFNFSLKD